MTRNEEKIKELCSSASADINLCRVAYTVIDNAPEEEKATLLEAFIIGYRNTPTNHSLDLPCFMDDKKKDLMLKKYGRQVDKRMMALQNMELPEKDFYDKLWRYLSTTPFLPTFEARVIGLYNCVIDKRLPYYAINRSASLSMDQEEFEAHLTSIGEKKLGRMEYILNADFDQKTEQSSLIVAMMDSLRTFEERTVFLARVSAHFKAELHRMKLRDFARMLEGRSAPRLPFSLDEDEDILSGLDIAHLFADDDDENEDSADDPGKPVF